jgi:hypothetical protein
MLPEYTPGANLYDYAFYGPMQTDDNAILSSFQVGGMPWGQQQQQQQQGGDDEIMQYIQMYSEITESDPEEVMSQISSMSQEDQQAALQEMVGTVQKYYTMQQSRQQNQMVDEQQQRMYDDEDESAQPAQYQKPYNTPTPEELAGLEAEEEQYNAAVEAATADYDEEYMYGGSKRGRNKFTSQLKKAARGMAQEMVNTDGLPTSDSSYGGERLKKFVAGIQRNVANTMADEAVAQSMDYFEQPNMMRYGGLPRYQGANAGSQTTGNQSSQNISLTPEQFNQLLAAQNKGAAPQYPGMGRNVNMSNLLSMFGAAPISNDWFQPRGYNLTRKSARDFADAQKVYGTIPLDRSYLSNVEAKKGFLGNINNPRTLSMQFSRSLPPLNFPEETPTAPASGQTQTSNVNPSAPASNNSSSVNNNTGQNNQNPKVGIPPLLDPKNISTTQPVDIRNYPVKPTEQYNPGLRQNPPTSVTGLSFRNGVPGVPRDPSVSTNQVTTTPNPAIMQYMQQFLTPIDLTDVGNIDLSNQDEIDALNREEGNYVSSNNQRNTDSRFKSILSTPPRSSSVNSGLLSRKVDPLAISSATRDAFDQTVNNASQGTSTEIVNSNQSIFNPGNTGLPYTQPNQSIPTDSTYTGEYGANNNVSTNPNIIEHLRKSLSKNQTGGQLYLYRNGGLPRFQGPDASQVTLAPDSISNPGQFAKTFGDSEFAMEPFDNSALVAARPQPMQLPTKTLQERAKEVDPDASMKTFGLKFRKDPLSAAQYADMAYAGTNIITNLKNRADQERAQAEMLNSETDPYNYFAQTYANPDEGININTYDMARPYQSFMGQRQQFSPGVSSGFAKFGGIMKMGGTYEMDLSPEEVAYIQRMGGTIEYL